MTRAIFRKTENGRIEMRVQGHAGFAEAGRDPVCAGVSVLTMTTVECVDALAREGLAKKPAKVSIHKTAGNVRVCVEPTDEGRNRIMDAFLFAQVGFGLLSEAYPDQVTVTMFEPEPVV